jgi:hypothetical protein
MDGLSYEVYNATSLKVVGDRAKFGKIVKQLGGRWNSRLKNGAGWTVPKSKEQELKKIIDDNDPKVKQLEEIATHAVSRKNQSKYHRAISETESEDSQAGNQTGNQPPNPVVTQAQISVEKSEPVHIQHTQHTQHTHTRELPKNRERENHIHERDRHKEKHRETHRETHRDHQNETRRHDKDRHKDKHRDRHETHKHDKDGHKEKHKDGHREKHKDGHKEKHRHDNHTRKHRKRSESTSSDSDSDSSSNSSHKKTKDKRKFSKLLSPRSSDDISSSSGDNSSSSDDFPLPESPKKCGNRENELDVVLNSALRRKAGRL